jgi:hypothetical protein
MVGDIDDIDEYKKFPTHQELKDNNLRKVSDDIRKRRESIHDYAKELGYETSQMPKGHWKDFKNIEKEISKLINNGNFPTQEMIISNLGTSVVNAIYRYHGNLNKVAEKMGYELKAFFKTSDGHYVQSANEYLFDEYLYSRGIRHDVGDLIHPSYPYRYDFKIDDNYFEIWGYEDNRKENKRCIRYNEKRKIKEELYAKLGYKLTSIEAKDFKRPLNEIELSFDNILENLGYDITLKKIDYDIKNVAKSCYFWNEETIVNQLKEIIEIKKTFPTLSELQKENKGGLGDAIKRFGGFEFFRKKLGCGLHHRPDGYWNDSTIIPEIEKVIEQIGHFPNYRELKVLKRTDLIKAIARNGGFISYQNKLLTKKLC